MGIVYGQDYAGVQDHSFVSFAGVSLRLHIERKAYLIRFAPLAFVPHRQIRSSQAPSPQVVFQGLQDSKLCLRACVSNAFYPYPWNTLDLSRSQV